MVGVEIVYTFGMKIWFARGDFAKRFKNPDRIACGVPGV